MKMKLLFGYYLFFSFLLLLSFFLSIALNASNFNFIFDYLLLIINGWSSGIILFFWMTYNLNTNRKLKYKFLWFLSFCIMFIGTLFYFWFVYKREIKESDTSVN